jgi:hypothetical protein
MKARLGSVFCGVVLMTACTASTVNTNGPQTSGHAPVDEQIDGEVSHLLAGPYAAHSRKDSYRRMYEYCGGSYRIVRHEDQLGGCLQAAQRRIWFKCVHSDTEGTRE